jgi:hypothetical protein
VPITSNREERPYHFQCDISVVKAGGAVKWVHSFGDYVNVFDSEPLSAACLRRKNQILDDFADKRGEAAAILIRQHYDTLYHAAAIDWMPMEITKKIPEVRTTAIYAAVGEREREHLHVLRSLIAFERSPPLPERTFEDTVKQGHPS